MLKKILIIACWLILVSGLIVLTSFVNIHHNQINCKKVELLIQYNHADYLLTEADVFQFLETNGIKMKDSKIHDINLNNIESLLYKIPYVEKADVFMNINGDIGIKIVQKTPLIKVFNQYQQSFYIDENGKTMPASSNYTARVIVANGFIENRYHDKLCVAEKSLSKKDSLIKNTSLYKVYKIAAYIQQDAFCSAMIEEIFINKNKEIELFTKIGNQTILFGNTEKMDEKFKKLYAFYKQILNKTGWEHYNVINLKYENQIVCSKI